MSWDKIFFGKYHYLIDTLVFLSTIIIFFILTSGRYTTDILDHTEILKIYLTEKRLPTPPGYYFALFGFNQFIDDFRIAAVFLLTLSVFFKYFLSWKFLGYFSFSETKNINLIKWVAVGLLLFFPVYFYKIDLSNFYLGKLTPNIWHNSTTIFCMPFVILLFWKTLVFLQDGNKGYFTILGLIFVVFIIKPSYLFVYLPSLVAILAIHRFNKEKAFYMISWVIWGGLGIYFIKEILYGESSTFDQLVYHGENSKVIIAPFEVWRRFNPNISLAVFSSLIGILIVFWFYFKQLWLQLSFQMALIQFLGAVMVWALFAESGPRMNHGNFYWQVPMAYYLLLLVIASFIFKQRFWAENKSLRFYLISGSFALHVLSGMLYLGKYLYFGVYE